MKEPKFYNKDGSLTRYSFSCGYVEKKDGLTLDMRHGVYQVMGFRDHNGASHHIVGSFAHVKEARQFMAHPFTHKPSRDGYSSISIAKR